MDVYVLPCSHPRAGSPDSLFFFSSSRRHTRLQGDWSSDVCSSDLNVSKVHVWELLTGGIAHQFAGHASASLSACFSADGRSLVTGGSDSTILIWDLAHGEIGRASCREKV